MRKISLVFLVALVSGCSYFKRTHTEQASNSEAPRSLVDQGANYCALAKPDYDARRWVVGRCDGVGFTSLHQIACPYTDLSIFEAQSGQFYRDPEHKCWLSPHNPENGASAQLSKDMVLMRMVEAFELKDRAWVDRFVSYGESVNWVVCDGDDDIVRASHCIVSVGLVDLLFDIKRALDGAPSTLALDAPSIADDLGVQVGYQAHLQVLAIFLAGRVHGAISDNDIRILQSQVRRVPRNALFEAVLHHFTDGDMARVYALLQDTSLFPIALLPTNHENYCADYLFQRDDDPSNWAPCPADANGQPTALITHPGTEWNLALYVARLKS